MPLSGGRANLHHHHRHIDHWSNLPIHTAQRFRSFDMAPRYSKKKAKFTYTERKWRILNTRPATVSPYVHLLRAIVGVLGALSDIQKDHRKHAVHMATLRAHSEY